MPRTCTVCTHAQRADIDAALIAGEPLRGLSAIYRVSEDALGRHRAHIPATLAKAQAAAEVAQADTLLAELRRLQEITMSLLAQAQQDGDIRTAVAAVGQARGNLELMGRLLGELQSQTTVNVALVQSPEWFTVRAVILKAIEPYPDARLALAGALSEVGQ